ncbi:hypothetical protein ACF2JD_02205 [Aeromonas sp. A-5]
MTFGIYTPREARVLLFARA